MDVNMDLARTEESWHLYRDLVENSPDLQWRCDRNGNLTYVNPAWQKNLGYPKEHYLGRNPSDFQDHDREDDSASVVFQPALGSCIQDVEMVLKAKDGALRTFVFNCQCLSDEQGKVLGSLGSAHDVTALKEASLAAQESEWKFRALFEKGPIGVAYHRLVFDSAGKPIDYRFLDANQGYITLTGVDPRGKLVTEAFPGIEKDPFDWIGTFAKVVLTGEELRLEQHVEILDRWYDLVAYRYGPDTFVVAFIESTEKKQALQALHRQYNLVASLLDNLPVGVFMVEAPSGKPLVSNALAVELLGRGVDAKARQETLSEVYQVFVAGTDTPYPTTLDPLMRGLSGERTQVDDLEVRRPDGSRRRLEVFGSPVIDERGVIWASLVSFVDVTERFEALKSRQELEKRLIQTQKLESLGTMAAGIAHDFNNLLGGIYGYLELASLESSDEKVSGYLQKTRLTMDRARSLTRQLLTFARGGVFVCKTLPLDRFLRETAAFALNGTTSYCQFEIDKGLWWCRYDREQLAQAVDNLVRNAQQSMPEGGLVVVSASNVEFERGPCVRIGIKDHGSGIPPEHLTHVFDPFFSTKTGGHGLGLSTCHSIVDRHGGCIEVKSETNQGTTFWVYLPAVAMAEESEPEVEPAPYAGRGTILIMDDELMIRETLKELLASLGHRVVATKDGGEALEVFAAHRQSGEPLAAAILDWTIPGGIGGGSVAASIRQLDAQFPILISSGYSHEGQGFDAATINARLTKPFSRNELMEVLGRVLGTGRQNSGTNDLF